MNPAGLWPASAYACLLTRLPHDAEVRPELPWRGGSSQDRALLALGFGPRVRCHDDLARIEVDRADQAPAGRDGGRSGRGGADRLRLPPRHPGRQGYRRGASTS
ncbi:MAG: hypothetical protein R3F40_15105 [Candidatus Competibacteraceae bacterium]